MVAPRPKDRELRIRTSGADKFDSCTGLQRNVMHKKITYKKYAMIYPTVKTLKHKKLFGFSFARINYQHPCEWMLELGPFLIVKYK